MIRFGSFRRWRGPLQWVLLGVVVALIVWRTNFADAWDVVTSAQPGWMVAGVALLVLSNLAHSIKWQKLLEDTGTAPLRELFAVFWSSMATNNILPFRAGDVLRVQVLSTRTGLPRTGIVATLLSERVLDGVSFAVILFAGLLLISDEGAELALVGAVLGGLTLVALAATVAVARLDPDREVGSRAWVNRLPARARQPAEELLPSFIRGLRPLGRPRSGVVAAAWAVGAWALESAAFWAFGAAFGLDLPLAAYLLVMVATNFAGSLTVLPGNLGVYEFAAIEILRASGATAGEATAYAFGSHILVIATISGIGMGTLAYLRVRPSDLSKMRAAAATQDSPNTTTAVAPD